ncbi:MAG: hypothetical protein WKG07_37310 [Hymenobacter sp.]
MRPLSAGKILQVSSLVFYTNSPPAVGGEPRRVRGGAHGRRGLRYGSAAGAARVVFYE